MKGTNVHDDGAFHIQIEYKNQMVTVTFVDPEGNLKECLSFQQELSYEGAWVITAGSGLSFPDKYEIIDFQLYDTLEVVSQKENEEFHAQHKKDAVKDMANFAHDHHVKDLLHSDKSFFNKE